MNLPSLFFSCVLCAIVCLVSGCATSFPRPEPDYMAPRDSATALGILSRCIAAHGGDLVNEVDDVNLSISGEWEGLIKKIQPLVTDFEYRIDSQERYLFSEDVKAVHWTGPKGSKLVLRSAEDVEVFYNETATSDKDVLESSALTSDAFALFHLGPSILKQIGSEPIRMSDHIEGGRRYYRLYFELTPGFGYSKRDEVVAYVDAESHLLYRVWTTLEGYETTEGATVDVTFNDYLTVDGYWFPKHMVERVRAPIGIKAHTWWLTGVDINRGLRASDVMAVDWSELASAPADNSPPGLTR